jgi:hypothetical protein
MVANTSSWTIAPSSAKMGRNIYLALSSFSISLTIAIIVLLDDRGGGGGGGSQFRRQQKSKDFFTYSYSMFGTNSGLKNQQSWNF